MTFHFELTPVERRLAESVRRGKLLDLSLLPSQDDKTIRAQVLVELATRPIQPWPFWPFHLDKVRLKGAEIIGGPPYISGANIARPVELMDCLIKEQIEIPYRQSA